ncbi:PP2C family serine/threonine-protein phosphatase [Halalkalibacter urbisdiaboli]|uniref:PP2C family serine/threonine-protein phosphatase n=1 Tax=Halalkalibacter urbisdiaboli TaxID=1960589 RepID=UPI000B44BBED|nr:PP2C family serine/threonine-protein phosphatase [Halalkalibacter urbisdiaboli]
MIKNYEHDQIDIVAFQEAKSGKSYCGDAHIVIKEQDYIVCAVIDGLGSGEWANHSAETATKVIKNEHDKDVEQIVEACNRALFNKRGVVLTIIKVDLKQHTLCYCNVGNVGFVLYQPDGTTVQPIPVRGYLSGRMQKISSKCYQIYRGTSFVLYSDGVKKPPSNKLMLEMKSPENQINEYVTEYQALSNDDLTLLIGKFK